MNACIQEKICAFVYVQVHGVGNGSKEAKENWGREVTHSALPHTPRYTELHED